MQALPDRDSKGTSEKVHQVDDGKAKRSEYPKGSVQYPLEGHTWKAQFTSSK